MKTIKNTLKAVIDTWTDPGSYPNSLAASPLPDYKYVDGVEGEVVLDLTEEEIADYHDCTDDFLKDLGIELPQGVRSVEWGDRLEGNRLILWVETFDAGPRYDE